MKKSVVAPNYQSYAKFGKYVCVSNKIFQVAPENVLRENGSPWWYFDEAQVIAKNAPDGWRLPTPVEANLIVAQICYSAGSKVMNAATIAAAFDFEYVGTGISLGNRSHLFGQYVGARVAFWTDTMREHTGITDMPAGYALVLHQNIVELGTILTEDHGACVRLIREVSIDEIAKK